MPHLFDELAMRGIRLRNRIIVAPMCQYSSENGFANEWHFVHLSTRAIGGAGLVITEAAAVEAEGRISPQDLGLYLDEHIKPLMKINRFMQEHGSVAGIQLAHAGRKASTRRPWEGGKPLEAAQGGWEPVVGPSALPFAAGYPVPHMLSVEEIARVVQAFGLAAARAVAAGFQVIEIHAAHGYLLHEFISPLSNHRTDAYGGDFSNRTRIVREVVTAIRQQWPEQYPLLLRLSVTDWTEGGWDVEQSIALARQVKPLGVDLIDCSSGGNVAHAEIPVGPGYQTGFAGRIKQEADIMTGAVGLITSPVQADHIVRTGQADAVLLARELLRDPYWPCRAAAELRHPDPPVPPQYTRAWGR